MPKNFQNTETHNQITEIEKRAADRAATQGKTKTGRPASVSSTAASALNIGKKDPATGITLRPAIAGIDGPGTPGVYFAGTGRITDGR